MTTNEGWDTLDDAMAGQIMVTDIAILSKKEKAPKDYVVVRSWMPRLHLCVSPCTNVVFLSD